MAMASGCSLARSTLAAAAARRRRRSRRRLDLDDLRAALGQGAGLVDDQRVDLLHPLERLGVPDQHAVLRALADADHDRHRRGQAQRTGTGDDEHGHGRDEGVAERRRRTPDQPQTTKASTATRMTTGTNQPATWSAMRWMGARLRWAAATMCDDLREQGVARRPSRRA